MGRMRRICKWKENEFVVATVIVVGLYFVSELVVHHVWIVLL